MRKIKDVLCLKLEAHLSHERIAAALGVSKGVVAKYVALASAAGLDWSQVQVLDEAALHSRLAAHPSEQAPLCGPTSLACTWNSGAKA